MNVSALSHLDERSIKASGAHYTPAGLAAFLAEVTVRHATLKSDPIRVLDPACGDGCLLAAIAQAVPASVRRRMELVGYDKDPTATEHASANLRRLDVDRLDVRPRDFLDVVVTDHVSTATEPLFATSNTATKPFDVVISNPPYVRTQVLGAQESRRLAAVFDLRGRVDLYHAFVKAISLVLRPGGVLGLLTSNRFMLIQSGASVRALLRQDFDLCDLYDLGDTKLFSAAVLPAILVARRGTPSQTARCPFTRVYESRGADSIVRSPPRKPSVLAALREECRGVQRTIDGDFDIERGELSYGADPRSPWSLSSPDTRNWLAVVHERAKCRFGDIAQVRVGIKTTADAVFIRDDWDELPDGIRPERELLKPLITHHVAARWLATMGASRQRRVLYPHRAGPDGEKRPVDLARYPRARAYLQMHRQRLEARQYLSEAGRQWYEIWVPQQPEDWPQRKIVYPDISEHPRFFLDTTGSIVNGDCYWITLNDRVDQAWLYLLLAVANSTFATAYYDTVFHNKLYAGRRRFMTQYVRAFPLPAMNGAESSKIIGLVSKAVESRDSAALDLSVEAELNALVWSSFGLAEKVRR